MENHLATTFIDQTSLCCHSGPIEIHRNPKNKNNMSTDSNCKHWSRICNFQKECNKNRDAKMSTSIPIDMSLDEMEETRFRKKYASLLKKILPTTHFNYSELETVMIIYYKIQKSGQDPKSVGMTRQQFREILHSAFDMTDDSMMERIFVALEKGPKQTGAQPAISMQTWAYTLSLFLRGTLEEKIEYCFNVYNPIGDGFIAKDALFRMLKATSISLGEDESDEAIKDISEIICKKLDIDRDGKISFNDFRESVLKSPMLLEALGPCLPSRGAVHAFLTTFTQLTGKV